MSCSWLELGIAEQVTLGCERDVAHDRDVVNAVYQRAGDSSSIKLKVPRSELSLLASNMYNQTYAYRIKLADRELLGYLKSSRMLPGQRNVLQSFSYLEFLQPGTSGNYFKVPVRYLNVEKLKFGIFQANMSYLEVLSSESEILPGYVSIDLTRVFTKEYRKVRVDDLMVASKLRIKADPLDVVCQLRLSSQERKEIHKRWITKA